MPLVSSTYGDILPAKGMKPTVHPSLAAKVCYLHEIPRTFAPEVPRSS